jgi:hypothetical protein
MSPDDLLLAQAADRSPGGQATFRVGLCLTVDALAGRVAALIGNSIVDGIPYAEGLVPFAGAKVWVLQQGPIKLCFGMPAGQTEPETVVAYYPSLWTGSYTEANALRVGVGGCFQGYISEEHGNQHSLARFDVTQIAADLAGRTLVSFEFQVTASWYAAGAQLILGTHAYDTQPSVGSTYTADRQRITWAAKTGEKITALSSPIVSDLLDGTATGLAFGPGLTESPAAHYGYLYGKGWGGEPLLKVTYL